MEEKLLHNIQKFAQRVRRDRYAKVYAPLGDGYRRVGLNEDAIQVCKEGLEIFPRYLACHEILGKVFLRQNRLADAKRELEKVYAVIQDNLELNKALIKVYARSGDAATAEKLLDKVIEKDPFDFEMRNLQTQIRREREIQKARAAAIARGEDPDAADIYNLPGRRGLVNIENIIAGAEEGLNYDRETQSRATDATLDSLEQLENTIDTEADRLAVPEPDPGVIDPDPETTGQKQARMMRQELLLESVEELSAAAVIAQIELEISLLDEASIVCGRLLKTEPEDEDLQGLSAKFAQRLEQKEAELERLEKMELARGL